MAEIIVKKNADGSKSYGTHVTVKGFKRTWQSFATKREAEAWRDSLTAELRSQKASGATRPDMATLTLASLNAAYLADPKATDLASFKDRNRQLAWWTLNYGTRKVLEFGVDQIREGRDKLTNGREPATVVRYLAAQRRAWNWARNNISGFKNHTWPTDIMLTEPDARVRFLFDDELAALLTAAAAHSSLMYAAITLALATGARSGEMFRLKWKDIDLDTGTARFLITKNKTPRSVHIAPMAVEAVAAIRPKNPRADDYVFIGDDGEWMSGQRIDRQWRRVRAAAKLTDFRWHDLRHSCASYLAQNKASLLEIGSVLGHKNMQTTLKYAHLMPGKAVTGHSALDAKLRAGSKS